MLIIIFIFIFSSLFNNIFTQKNSLCEKAPDNITKSVCNDMLNAMKNASEDKDNNNPFLKPGFEHDSAPDRPELKCLNLSCYCSYVGGKSNGSINDCTLSNGQKVQKAIRKELRMLTDSERADLFNAIRDMKNNIDYDYIAVIHGLAFKSNAAHGGPAFLPWHREYIKRFEILLRKRNPTLALPYWDSTLDGRLPNPADSILFSDDFLGTTDSQGNVVTGPFSPWPSLDGDDYIKRAVGKGGGCFIDIKLQWTLSQTKVENVLSYVAPGKQCPFKIQWNALEIHHGDIHTFIGGDMQIFYPNKAAEDVVFFFHHSFVNLIFESWRQSQQTRIQRVNDYPPDIAACGNVGHFKNATLTQFSPLKNIDGLKNEYNDNLYEYAPRPTCNAITRDCGTKYLFCDISHGSPQCAAKVRIGGNCTGFTKGEQVCFNSNCQNGICVTQAANTTITKTTKNINNLTTLKPNNNNKILTTKSSLKKKKESKNYFDEQLQSFLQFFDDNSIQT